MSRQQGPRRIQVDTNSFKIIGLPKKKYYQYDVSFDPHIPQARRRIDVFERLQNHTEPKLFTPKVIYDSYAIAYSSRELPFGNSATFEVNMTDRPPRGGETRPRGYFTVKLLRVNAAPVDFEDLQRLVDGHTNQLQVGPRATVALNLIQLIFRQEPNLKYANNFRAFFCKEAGYKSLGGGLEVFKGFFQSVRPAYKALLLNIDTSCSVIYQEGAMIDVALSVLGTNHPRALNISEGSPDFRKLEKFFKGVLVSLTHRRVKKKIEAIVSRGGLQEFEHNKDGSTYTTTVQAYFREAYNISLKWPEAVGVRIRGGAIIPIELCVVEPNQRYTRKLPQEMTKKMVDFTSEKPKARLEAILRGIVGHGAVLDYTSSPYMKDAELRVATTPTVIDGKVLPTPPIQYSRGSQPCIPKAGAWNAVNQQFLDPKPISSWAVIDYSPNPSRDRQANERFVKMLGENCQKLGMKMAPPSLYLSGNGSNVQGDFRQVARQAAGGGGAPPDMILVILPSSAPEIRLHVKQEGDVLQGVVTQCVRVDKVARANDQYCNNVAMKINAKLGGVNAVPQSRVMTQLGSEPFMIMGADVGHPSPGVNDQPSIASLVWSYDQAAMRYEAFTSVQPPRMENILELQGMVKQAIVEFGRPPTKLIFFRDGLSESEYEKVADKEIGDIQNAVDEIWKEKGVNMPKPKLTFIVVGKRHHVRFFPRTQNDGDRSGNCPAGFVADQGIGNPIAKDYYLQSHGGLLGTSRPSHYVVIKDEIFSNNIDSLQELSFVLCHAYARATRSVSIPAPVYYADIVCGRANFHFRPDLKYDDSAASVTSGGSSFNLDKWRNGFKQRHRNMARKMFYM